MTDPGLSARFSRCGMGAPGLARLFDDLGAEALRQGSVTEAGELWDVSDKYAIPSDGTVVARMLLMVRVMERQEARDA